MSTSIAGSAVPALIGVVGTILASRSDNQENVVALLVAWTIIGYLMLSDFGLTRSSSKFISGRDYAPERVIAALWRVATPLGLLLTFGVVGALLVIGGRVPGTGFAAMGALCVVPLLAAWQFPLIGALEAKGRFGVLALHRTAAATFTYLLPAMLISQDSGGVAIAVASMTGYRLVSLVILWRQLAFDARELLQFFVSRRGEAHGVPVRAVLTWVAISSMIGPFLLYVDRAFLGTFPVSKEMWIYYVSLSELLIKTYVIPAAVLSVGFPWLVTNMRVRLVLIRRLFIGVVPATTIAMAALLGSAIFILVPDAAFTFAGLPESDVTAGRIVAAVAVSCTAVNWVSQAYIALLHAIDRQKRVAVAQMALAAPYILALSSAQLLGGVSALSTSWGLRILVLSALLLAFSGRSLNRLSHTS